MHFCKVCHNMYYIQLSEEEENVLMYYCRKCGDIDSFITEDNMCVSELHLKKEENKYYHIINKYTKLDPTLPRIKNLKCPNDDCLSNSSSEEQKKNEIIYMRYDNINIKYVYICALCDTIWTTDKKNYEKI